jgi:vacuolar-type H+-ATPase subunit E/Vma4
MSLEAIAKRIADEAAAEAAAVLQTAKAEREELLRKAREELEEEYAQDLRRLNAESSEWRSKLAYHVRREEERRLENATRETLDGAILSAAARLASLPDAEYMELVKSTLDLCTFDGRVEVIISPADGSRITQSFLASSSIPGRTFALSPERHDQVGGVILRSGKISLNATFTRIAALAHEQLVNELSTYVSGRG